jgi:starch synthase (maltosyl-transferring)
VLFLSEAFTDPTVMYRLAKLGFSRSYTYFAWRNTEEELTDYFTELTQTEVREFFRPNLWPNTLDPADSV